MMSRLMVVVLSAGVVLGALGDRVWQVHTVLAASAATIVPMPMTSSQSTGMKTLPIGDSQMMKAMTGMDAAMKGAHLNGDQDHDFMQLMIPHHEAAIEMAQVELRYGLRPQLKVLARDIIKSQTAEIAQMRQWLCKWEADCKTK